MNIAAVLNGRFFGLLTGMAFHRSRMEYPDNPGNAETYRMIESTLTDKIYAENLFAEENEQEAQQ